MNESSFRPEETAHGAWPSDHIPADQRTLVAAQHLSPLLAFWLPVLGNVIGALVAWLLTRDRHPVLDDQGREVVNFQISISLYFLAVTALVVLTLGIGILLLWPLVLALYALQFITMILAVVATIDGRPYRYPFSIRFLR
ncbi:DUF4870 domain-containing protein [Deinococcus peraridilitoris]|uniref:Tic20-like protein n=1 Tax=Deinococcus peraridilitoris (strain DSM 19664 / LMG 22246 / CIP 109416 / KR-200) TaxID=937777 RepID=K9ZY60_DEIPD|nr:DUF4870 domain-containing protein [Deinococcus peraridilitoris]AFZ65872.1 hypothetical protein Deipe_0271 [Deinococcus peraridilitoris DSM 19664]